MCFFWEAATDGWTFPFGWGKWIWMNSTWISDHHYICLYDMVKPWLPIPRYFFCKIPYWRSWDGLMFVEEMLVLYADTPFFTVMWKTLPPQRYSLELWFLGAHFPLQWHGSSLILRLVCCHCCGWSLIKLSNLRCSKEAGKTDQRGCLATSLLVPSWFYELTFIVWCV